MLESSRKLIWQCICAKNNIPTVISWYCLYSQWRTSYYNYSFCSFSFYYLITIQVVIHASVFMNSSSVGWNVYPCPYIHMSNFMSTLS